MGQATGRQILVTAFVGFVLFRIFDISKPWPIRKLEKYPAGWGILADDLLAGLFAWIVLQIFIRFLIVI
jgi:phosphatidylglycerophosphatase A